MGNRELLELAFALAESGKVSDIGDVRARLMREGFTYAELGQFSGSALSRQIIAKIAMAKAKRPRPGQNLIGGSKGRT
jgi:hypothetical protein